jgi:hypothetical protein
MIVIDIIFTGHMRAGQPRLKNSYTDFCEDPTNSLVCDTSLQTDKRRFMVSNYGI